MQQLLILDAPARSVRAATVTLDVQAADDSAVILPADSSELTVPLVVWLRRTRRRCRCGSSTAMSAQSRRKSGIARCRRSPRIRRRRAWSSGPTSIWRPRSCPGAPSPARPTSTPSSQTGSPVPTTDSTVVWAVVRSSGGPPIGPRCSRCRRSPWFRAGRNSLRLPRDHYVRIDANDYSVHPSAIGRRVTVTGGLEQILVACEGVVVARHDRCWARHQTITDPDHAAAAAILRRARQQPAAAPVETEVEYRSLDDYDRVFGLAGQVSV